MNLYRLLPLTSPILLLGLAATPARADVFYTFEAFGSTATFSLPDNPTPSAVGSDFFQFDNLLVTITGEGTFTGDVDFLTRPVAAALEAVSTFSTGLCSSAARSRIPQC